MERSPVARPSSARSVAHYYDRNTERFLRFGGAGRAHSIHRQLWGPAVRSPEEAATYVNRLVAERIRAAAGADAPANLTILDMGCGVGGTLFHLGAELPDSELHGITISPKQRQIGCSLANRLGLADRCHIRLGDFQEVRLGVLADAVVAIESFVHATSAERFFASAAAHLVSGGRLFLVDDFLTDAEALDARGRRILEEFRRGWRAPGIRTVAECRDAAGGQGLELEADEDLTALIRLGRPRDRAIARLGPLLRLLRLEGLPFFGNLIGGDALHTALREGLFSYRFLELRRIDR